MHPREIYQALKNALIDKGLSNAEASARALALLNDAMGVFRSSVATTAQTMQSPDPYAVTQKARADLFAWIADV